MAHQVCVKPNLLRPLVPSKVAVEAVVLHPAQLALLSLNQQKKNAPLVKSAKNVRHVTMMANLKLAIAVIVVTVTIVAIVTIAMAVTVVVVTAMTATAMVATTVVAVVATVTMT
jgi:hypothetical protein